MVPAESYTHDDFPAQIELLRTRVQAHCFRLLKDECEAADAAQESLTKAWENRQNFRHDSPLEHWVMRISTYHCLNVLRKRNGVPTIAWEDSKEHAPPDAVQGLSHSERRVWLNQLLASLRTCMGARDYWIWRQKIGGMTEMEIARNLPQEWKLSKDGVHSRLQRNIKTCLDKERQAEYSAE